MAKTKIASVGSSTITRRILKFDNIDYVKVLLLFYSRNNKRIFPPDPEEFVKAVDLLSP